MNDIAMAEYRGILYNPYMPRPVPFNGVWQMISAMEAFFDDICFPQAFYDLRTFGEKSRRRGIDEDGEVLCLEEADPHALDKRGELTSFLLEVQFRQNATWQGQLHWIEQDRARSFRSILEMLRLIDAALGQSGLSDIAVSWSDVKPHD